MTLYRDSYIDYNKTTEIWINMTTAEEPEKSFPSQDMGVGTGWKEGMGALSIQKVQLNNIKLYFLYSNNTL